MEKLEIDISMKALIKILALVLIVALIQHLLPLILLIFLAVLLAVALEPFLMWLELRMPRWASLTILIATVIALFAGFVFFVMPPLLDQLNRVIQKIPGFTSSVLNHLPKSSVIYEMGEKFLKNPHPDLESWIAQIFTVGQLVIGGLSSLFLVIALMIYLLIDGRGTYEWVIAFFKVETRVKLRKTADEVAPVISAYMIGQLVTSVLCSIFVFAMLKTLDVPAALMLAVLAGIFDVLPIIGFFLSVIPSVIFALTVSPTVALTVFALYCVYHAIENYLIVPKIYGSRLRLSGLAVLVAILIGVALGGILGAIVILPIFASYSIIERIWLAPYIGERVVEKHEALEGNSK